MALNSTEILVDTIAQRLEQLLNERNLLLSEVNRKSIGSLEQDKSFVYTFHNAVFDKAEAHSLTAKLEHLLLLR